MRRAVRQLSSDTFEVVDLFDPSDVHVLTTKQIQQDISSGVQYYGVTKKGRITVFSSISDMIEYDTMQRRLAGYPLLYYSSDVDDISVVGMEVKIGVWDLVFPSFVSAIEQICPAIGHKEGGMSIRSITIPDSVLELGNNVFYMLQDLEKVKLSNRLTEIPQMCFAWATSLKSVDLPDSVTHIDDYAFRNSGVEYLKLSNNLKAIGSFAFSNTSIRSLHIPDSVESLGNKCFVACRYLSDVSLPIHLKEQVQRGNVFNNCPDVTLHYRR